MIKVPLVELAELIAVLPVLIDYHVLDRVDEVQHSFKLNIFLNVAALYYFLLVNIIEDNFENVFSNVAISLAKQ